MNKLIIIIFILFVNTPLFAKSGKIILTGANKEPHRDCHCDKPYR